MSDAIEAHSRTKKRQLRDRLGDGTGRASFDAGPDQETPTESIAIGGQDKAALEALIERHSRGG